MGIDGGRASSPTREPLVAPARRARSTPGRPPERSQAHQQIPFCDMCALEANSGIMAGRVLI